MWDRGCWNKQIEISWEGGRVRGGWGAMKYQAKVTSTMKTAKWHPLVLFSAPHSCHTKLLNPWPNSSASHVVKLITAGCLLVKGRWNHLKTTHVLMDAWQASETSHSKSILGNFQYQCLPELLVDVYSYRLIEKSVSCCCVCGRWLFSNLVANILT